MTIRRQEKKAAGKPKRRAKKVKNKAAKKKATKKKTGTARTKSTRKRATKKASVTSTLAKLQPELEKALSRLLDRRQRQLNKLPRTAQLKLLEVEKGGFTYTLSRLRPPTDDNLTHRQKQIARQVSQGLSNKEIGKKLQISSATVAAHLRTIFTKLKVKTRTALAKHAIAYYG